MIEPLNSWEVSYVLVLKGCYVDRRTRNIDYRQVLGTKRSAELREWANQHFSPQWLYEHTQ